MPPWAGASGRGRKSSVASWLRAAVGLVSPLCRVFRRKTREEAATACLGTVKNKCGKIRVPRKKIGGKHATGGAKL